MLKPIRNFRVQGHFRGHSIINLRVELRVREKLESLKTLHPKRLNFLTLRNDPGKILSGKPSFTIPSLIQIRNAKRDIAQRDICYLLLPMK